MDLKRETLSDKYYGYHTKVNIGTKSNTIFYLDELTNFLNKYEFEENPNFVLCGRKKYIIDEIHDIMEKNEISYDTVYFILGSLEEFMCNNNHISMTDNFIELRDKNDEYVKTGVICKEEKEYIDQIIQAFKKYLDESSQNNIEEEIERIIERIKELPSGTETCVADLIGTGAFYKYTTEQLFKITNEFIKKCEENNIELDFSKYKDMHVGLLFNINFIKV